MRFLVFLLQTQVVSTCTITLYAFYQPLFCVTLVSRETRNVSSRLTSNLDQIANHIQSGKTLSLFSLLCMPLLLPLCVSSTRQTAAPCSQGFQAFKSNMTDTPKKDPFLGVSAILNLNLLKRTRMILFSIVSPCDLARLSRTFPVQIVAEQQACRLDANLNPS